MSLLRRLYYFIRLGRPLFLIGGFVFHGLGVLAALYEGAVLNWQALIWGQVAITAIQLMTHYSNDYFDLPADSANPSPTYWSGGSKVLPAGHLPPWVALGAALFFGGVALLAIVILGFFIQPSPWTFILPIFSLLLAWEYSAPPLNLHSRGVGELTVALIVPVLTPLVGYTFQAGAPGVLPLLASVPLAFFQACMIIAVNIPDAAGDRQVDKRTLVIRLGPERSAQVYVGFLGLAYGSLPLMVAAGLPPVVATAAALSLPLALWLGIRMLRGAWHQPETWNSLGFWTIGLLMGTAALEVLAFAWLVFN